MAEDDTIHGCFLRQALRTPDAPALLACEAYGPPAVLCTYRELERAVAALASAFRAAAELDGGTTGGSNAGLLRQCAFLLGSCPARIVGYLACLTAGLAFTPLETSHPPAVLARRPSMPFALAFALALSRGFASLTRPPPAPTPP